MTVYDFLKKWALAVGVYEGLPVDRPGSLLVDLNALLDAERAKAREEQREADVAAVLAPAREKDPGLDRDHPEEVHAARVRRAPLTATPLTGRIAELKRERDALVNRVDEVECERDEWKRAEEDAKKRIAELERSTEGLKKQLEAAFENGVQAAAEARQIVERECDEARAEAARLAETLDEYVRLVELVTEELGPMTAEDRAEQLDCDATAAMRVRKLRTRAEKAEAELTTLKAQRFPVMTYQGAHFSVPWSAVAPFEHQAMLNHGGQTLERLTERGGLSPIELWHVTNGRRFSRGQPHPDCPSEADCLAWALRLAGS